MRAGALARIPQAKRMAKLHILGARLDGDRHWGGHGQERPSHPGVSCIRSRDPWMRVELNIPQLGDQVVAIASLSSAPPSRRARPPCPGLSAQAGIKVLPDHAQVVRRYPFLFRSGPSVYPSLAMQLYRTAYPEESVERLQEIQASRARTLSSSTARPGTSSAQLSDVMESPPGTLSLRQAIQDRIVLVGVSALGTEDYEDSGLPSSGSSSTRTPSRISKQVIPGGP